MDKRRTPLRHDLAAEHLRGQVDVEKFVEGTAKQVSVPLLDLVSNADPSTPNSTQLLYGEGFTVYDEIPDMGLSWGQSDLDGYVGYVASEGLTDPAEGALTAITAASALVFSKADLKSLAIGAFSLGCRVSVTRSENGYANVGEGMFISEICFRPISGDFVSVAENFIGVPYYWGGRSHFGLDCSALVQLSLQAVGEVAPRDSDMQEAELGVSVDRADLQRGDLVFWKGHVGIMRDAETLLHANAHHMLVTSEALSEVEDRAEGPITGIRRIN